MSNKGEVIYINKLKNFGTLESESGEKYFFKLDMTKDISEGDKVRFDFISSNLKGLLGISSVVANIIDKEL